MSAVRTTCPYCGIGCGLLVSRTDGAGANGFDPRGTTPSRGSAQSSAPGGRSAAEAAAFRVAGDPAHPSNFGRLCSKGAALAETLGLEGRLLHPEVRGRRVAWDEALDTVAAGFVDTVAEHGPDAVAFYVSGQMLTEDYYVANKLMKGFIGGANIDTNSRLCMASAVAGHKRAFGADAVPVSYADVDLAELVVIVGSNTAWCHPVLYQRIVGAKAANPRVRVVVVDPRRTATCDAADLFLPIRPGTDAVLFNGLLNHLRREDALDFEFLDAHTEGIGAALKAARETAPSIPAVALACGLAEDAVATLYRWFAATERTVTLFSQGVNQSSSGTDKVNAIVNAHLATGRIGKPGAGPFSLTGQPNAMGGREVGGLSNQLAAHMDFAPEHVERVGRFWNAPALASKPGLKAVELFEAIEAGTVKAVWIMCTNPVVSMPDADRVERALRRCGLVVVSECMRHTDTANCADILLPAATWGEKSGTVTSSERRISRQRAFLPAPGESRPDWWIVTQVARRMGFGAAFPYESPAEIFREHACLSGYENEGTRAFDIGALARVGDAEYDGLEPVRWPVRHEPELPALFADGRFFTADRKAKFVPILPAPPRNAPDARRPLILNTGRVRDQWHTMTRTGASPTLSGHRPEPFVEVSPTDAARSGLASGDLAALASGDARVLVRVDVTDAVQPGQVFVPMHWGRQHASRARVGALIPPVTDPHSGQPELKGAVVALEPFRPAWHGFVLSRARLSVDGHVYVVRSKGAGFWRYEFAGDGDGDGAVPSWPAWARSVVGAGGDWIELSDPAAGRYRGAAVRAGRLAACIFVATGAALTERDWLMRLFAEERLTPADRRAILAGRAGEGRAGSGPVICSCFGIGRAELLRAIRGQRLMTAKQIGRALGAGTSCGSCVPELKALIAETKDAAPTVRH